MKGSGKKCDTERLDMKIFESQSVRTSQKEKKLQARYELCYVDTDSGRRMIEGQVSAMLSRSPWIPFMHET